MKINPASPSAILVHDNSGESYVNIPEHVGKPRDDQMQGSAAEQLTELSGRICYDSLGTGRPSIGYEEVTGADPITKHVEGYHEHILKLKHTSVLRHYNFTVKFGIGIFKESGVLAAMLNRPGVFVVPEDGGSFRVSANICSVIEWARFTDPKWPHWLKKFAFMIGIEMAGWMQVACPHIFELAKTAGYFDPFEVNPRCEYYAWRAHSTMVAPEHDEEKWVSLYLAGSRGFSHEQVRHMHRCAVSQRSTRFCDETNAPWIQHPLLKTFIQTADARFHRSMLSISGKIAEAETRGRYAYDAIVGVLEEWLTTRKVDKTTARKQARGAARGYLGNALETDMIFSASVAQWKRMLAQRATQAADAEIRGVFCGIGNANVLEQLKRSAWGDSFADYVTEPADDGIGWKAGLATGQG